LFADDLKIYVVIDDVSCPQALQDGLNNLAVWASEWQLNIYVPKCSVLHIGSMTNRHSYHINNCMLPNVSSVKDLGVIMDSEMRFNINLVNMITRAHQRASLIMRCFKSRDPVTLFRAFVVYVRPIVEYCAPVWSPCYITYISKIEAVQRRFTKRLSGFHSLTYAQRLQRLNVESLEERRIKFDMHTIFKIVHKLVDINDELFIRSVESLNLRGHNQRFFKPQVRLNCRAHSFACRNINVWNSLPQAAVDCKSLVAFKNALNELSFSKYLHLEP